MTHPKWSIVAGALAIPVAASALVTVLLVMSDDPEPGLLRCWPEDGRAEIGSVLQPAPLDFRPTISADQATSIAIRHEQATPDQVCNVTLVRYEIGLDRPSPVSWAVTFADRDAIASGKSFEDIQELRLAMGVIVLVDAATGEVAVGSVQTRLE